MSRRVGKGIGEMDTGSPIGNFIAGGIIFYLAYTFLPLSKFSAVIMVGGAILALKAPLGRIWGMTRIGKDWDSLNDLEYYHSINEPNARDVYKANNFFLYAIMDWYTGPKFEEFTREFVLEVGRFWKFRVQDYFNISKNLSKRKEVLNQEYVENYNIGDYVRKIKKRGVKNFEEFEMLMFSPEEVTPMMGLKNAPLETYVPVPEDMKLSYRDRLLRDQSL